MKTFQHWVAVATFAIVFVTSARADILELRGTGVLPDVGIPTVGVPGEAIRVSVLLDSQDFDYVPLSNSVIHYFAPSTTVPVEIVGSVTGEYADVSPIARFVALELENSTSRGDMISLDVAAAAAGTSLLSLSTAGASGFDGRQTPLNSDDLFALFAGAMDNQGLWTPSSSSAVFVGADPELLFLGQLEWTLVNSAEGDLDGDGDVDGRDFLTWQREPTSRPLTEWKSSYGGTAPISRTLSSPGDFDGDGGVDGHDLLLWQRDLAVGNLAEWQGDFATYVPPATLAVPEPTGGILAAIGAWWAAGRGNLGRRQARSR